MYWTDIQRNMLRYGPKEDRKPKTLIDKNKNYVSVTSDRKKLKIKDLIQPIQIVYNGKKFDSYRENSPCTSQFKMNRLSFPLVEI